MPKTKKFKAKKISKSVIERNKKRAEQEVKAALGSKEPPDIDTVILDIMAKTLFVYGDEEGIVCNTFEAAKQIRNYFKKLYK